MGSCLSKKEPESLHAMNDSVHVMMHRSAKKNKGASTGYVPRERHPSIGFGNTENTTANPPTTEATTTTTSDASR